MKGWTWLWVWLAWVLAGVLSIVNSNRDVHAGHRGMATVWALGAIVCFLCAMWAGLRGMREQ